MKMHEHRPSVVSFNRPPSYVGHAPSEYRSDPEADVTSSRGISVRMSGIIQVVVGIASVAIGLLAIFLECYLSFYAIPIWAGILFYIGCGVIGIKAYYRKMSKGTTIAYMAMCTCNAVLAAGLMIMYIHVAMVESRATTCFSAEHCKLMRIKVIVNILVILLSFCELAVAITGSALACCRICQCCTTRPNGVNMIYYNSQNGTGQTSIPQYDQHETVGSEPASFQTPSFEPATSESSSRLSTAKMMSDVGVQFTTTPRPNPTPVHHAHFESMQAQGGQMYEKVTV